MQTKHLLAALCLAACPALAWSASARDQLRQFVASVSVATGTFKQQTLGTPNDPGKAKPPESGRFAFRRPGRFRWEVKKPYEQLIVSDGKTVYQYDPDLAQVIERDVSKSIGASPAAILFGSGSLDDAFVVTPLPDKDGLQWLRATPRKADAGFAHVDMGFSDNKPVRLELLDSFGQITRIDLSDIQTNPTLPASEFTFALPKGVDVVHM
ncbi:MAG TPA: outer membrane lipoprotein chaperone LolA [Burkholderiaceae bacterium]|nr:outer membrane lipoprotein chaperone LolA [Burkholderiaceae bacterium]